jgi:3-methyladenine DNA glycosylase AlkD
MNLEKYGFDESFYQCYEGMPARVTAVHRERYKLICEMGECYGRLKTKEYYVNMAIAWYFATALATQYSATLPYLTEHRLSPWIHAKTIQKAIESYRVPTERKEELKKYRKRPKI